MRTSLSLSIAALLLVVSGCASDNALQEVQGKLWHRTTPEELVAIKDVRKPVAVRISSQLYESNIQYGVLKSDIPQERMIETTADPNSYARSDTNQKKLLDALHKATRQTSTTLTGKILADIANAGANAWLTQSQAQAQAQALVPPDPQASGPTVSIEWRPDGYSQWMKRELLEQGASGSIVSDEHFLAGFLGGLGWPASQPARKPDDPDIYLGVTRIALFRTEAGSLVLLMCGHSSWQSGDLRSFESCQTTGVERSAEPSLGDAVALKKLISENAEKLGRLQAKAMTSPVALGERLPIKNLAEESLGQSVYCMSGGEYRWVYQMQCDPSTADPKD